MLPKLHYISQEPHLPNILSACEAGCDLVQLRVKEVSTADYLLLALEAKSITDSFGTKLIINDNVEVAKAVKAYGVHVGKEDLSPIEARLQLGEDYVIGGSTNSLDDILRLVDSGVNYVGLGPFRFTTTKSNLNPVLGLKGMEVILNEVQKRQLTLPILAIGGISLDDIALLKQIGVYGVALSGTITQSKDKSELVKSIKALLY